MNRKHIQWVLILVFTVTGIVIGYKLSKKLETKEKFEIAQQTLSSEGIEYLESIPIPSGKPTILSLYHPSCDFCQADAKQFSEASTHLESYEILWVSYDEKDSIQKFAQAYGWDSLPNIHFAYMDIEAMLARYGNVKFPTFLAYDKYGQLIKKWVGMTEPQEILKAYSEAKR